MGRATSRPHDNPGAAHNDFVTTRCGLSAAEQHGAFPPDGGSVGYSEKR